MNLLRMDCSNNPSAYVNLPSCLRIGTECIVTPLKPVHIGGSSTGLNLKEVFPDIDPGRIYGVEGAKIEHGKIVDWFYNILLTYDYNYGQSTRIA